MKKSRSCLEKRDFQQYILLLASDDNIHINWINCVDSFKLFMPLEIRQDTHFSCSHNISFFVVKHQTTFTFTQEDIELFYDDLEEDFEEGLVRNFLEEEEEI